MRLAGRVGAHLRRSSGSEPVSEQGPFVLLSGPYGKELPTFYHLEVSVDDSA